MLKNDCQKMDSFPSEAILRFHLSPGTVGLPLFFQAEAEELGSPLFTVVTVAGVWNGFNGVGDLVFLAEARIGLPRAFRVGIGTAEDHADRMPESAERFQRPVFLLCLFRTAYFLVDECLGDEVRVDFPMQDFLPGFEPE